MAEQPQYNPEHVINILRIRLNEEIYQRALLEAAYNQLQEQQKTTTQQEKNLNHQLQQKTEQLNQTTRELNQLREQQKTTGQPT